MTAQGFRIELAPTPEQAQRLLQHAGLHRVVFNHALHRVKAVMDQRTAERLYGITDDDITPALSWSAPALEAYWRATHAAAYPWFTEEALSSRVPKEACRALAAALKNWAASKSGKRRGPRVGFPRFRRRKDGFTFRVDADRAHPRSESAVHVPGVGEVATREDMSWLTDRLGDGRARVVGSRFEMKAGRWWVAFQLQVDRTDIDTRYQAPKDGPKVGIDLGLSTFATLRFDDGRVEKVANPRHLTRALRRLRQANKTVVRRKAGSANRAKAVKKLARVHLDVAHARGDFHHKLSTSLTRSNSVIVVETLNVAGMVKNRRLSRLISDAGWGEFVRQLTYKARWYGSSIVSADRWYPSSKLCSACGAINDQLTLADRRWTCACGVTHDRDVNAARNLLSLAA